MPKKCDDADTTLSAASRSRLDNVGKFFVKQESTIWQKSVALVASELEIAGLMVGVRHTILTVPRNSVPLATNFYVERFSR
jgi:hypothetical protein